jgi:hypothetical protein
MKIKLIFNFDEMGVSEWQSQKPKECVVSGGLEVLAVPGYLRLL